MVGTHVHVRMSKDRNFMVGTHVHVRMRNNRIFYVCAWVIKQGWHQCATVST